MDVLFFVAPSVIVPGVIVVMTLVGVVVSFVICVSFMRGVVSTGFVGMGVLCVLMGVLMPGMFRVVMFRMRVIMSLARGRRGHGRF